MKRISNFLHSDGVDRYGNYFPVRLLSDALKQHSRTGLPQCIGHDLHRPIGWVFPFGIYFHPNVARLVGDCWICETEPDFEDIRKAHTQAHLKHQAELTKDYYDDLCRQLSGKINDGHKAIFLNCAAILQENIAVDIFPEIFQSQDSDGLIPLKVLLEKCDYLGQGNFSLKGSSLTLHAHKYFRRALSHANNFHHLFLDDLISVFNATGAPTSLRLDADIVGHKGSFKFSMEHEFWRGPKFNDQISDIKGGLTQHEASEFERAYNNILRTEFFWYKRDGAHVLECEEVANSPSPGLKNWDYGCRYVHAIHDDKASRFIHFDGAIRAYTEDKMISRQDTSLDKAPRDTQYTKLFRIDENLSASDWKRLCVLYFQSNYQIQEYFGLKDEKPPTQMGKDGSAADFTRPIMPHERSGPRIFLSIQEKIERTNISFFNYDEISTNTERVPAIEAEAIELIKNFRAHGINFDLDHHTIRVDCDDSYLNLPSIFFPSRNSLITSGIPPITQFLSRLKGFSERNFVSAGFAVPFEDASLHLAFSGHIDLLLGFLTQMENIPNSWDDLGGYVENLSNWMRQHECSFEIPDLEFFKRDGVLHFHRPSINHHFDIVEDDGKKILRPTNDYVAFVLENGLAMQNLMVLLSSICSFCGAEYATCPHMKGGPDNIDEDVQDARIASIVVTRHNPGP